MQATLQTGAAVAGVGLIGPADARFEAAVEALWGCAPDEVLRPALPFAVLVQNEAARAVALLGVRFDMENRDGKRYSVVHYADSLRNPESADLTPGRMRFVCVEPLYTNLVLRRERQVDERGALNQAKLNLANLLHAREIRAQVDCVAFADGEFAGPDTNGAFDRMARERADEEALVAAVLREGSEARVVALCEAPAAKVLARRVLTELVGGGLADAQLVARNHRCRIPLRRV